MKEERDKSNTAKRKNPWWRGAWGVLVVVLSFKLLLISFLKAGLGGEKQTRGLDMHVPEGKIEQHLLSPQPSQETTHD